MFSASFKSMGYPEIMILRMILRLILEVESKKSHKSNDKPPLFISIPIHVHGKQITQWISLEEFVIAYLRI